MENNIYIVKNKRQETEDTFTLSLVLEDGTIPEFISGQYINIFFPELNTPEGKAYSISSSPEEGEFNITVKIIGEFSTKLSELREGDKIQGSLPYGFFYPEEDDRDLVLIAGGIGITPFRSIIKNNLNKNRNIKLFHSIQKNNHAIFLNDLKDLSENIEVHYYITREESSDLTNSNIGRIDIKQIIEKTKNLNNPEFMICGSISFVRDIWKNLKEEGVSEDDIYTEAFFSH